LLAEGPLLIVANHPNSFLDAIIIGCQFNGPVHFLARGDAFNKNWHAKLLHFLNMIPVYRLSEGKENLYLNEGAFQKSKEILTKNGIVLIFIEGICVHKHELQPFKKGAARIAKESSSKSGLQILPIGIAYDSFEHFGKEVNITIGNTIPVHSLFPFEEDAKSFRYFNETMYEEINKRIDIPVSKKGNQTVKIITLLIPATIGYILHFPLYAPL
jgi:1-acyl-sn-glycerol-3-phosphate acyltransferase